MSPRIKSGILAGMLGVVGACGALPDRVDDLEKARGAVRVVEQDELASEIAANELAAAREAIAEADEAFAGHRSIELIEHRAYVAQRYADIARERIATARAKEQLARFESERDEVLLRSRTHEIEVLTLGDVLFDSNGTELMPGAAAALDRLARFMRDFPGRQLMIEGHTDARGPELYNVQLSERRADSVRDALVARGIGAARIRTTGLGESYPVVSNDTPEGMRENRRVVILISDDSGRFPETGERAIAANLL
jgi:outer membrane protein OmpA-like peptidoglycan-associated protein